MSDTTQNNNQDSGSQEPDPLKLYYKLARRIDKLEQVVDILVGEKNSAADVHKAQMADLISPASFSECKGMANGTEDMFEKMAKRKAALKFAQHDKKVHPLSTSSLRAKRIVAFAKTQKQQTLEPVAES